MADRDKILKKIEFRKPDQAPTGYLSDNNPSTDDLIIAFTENLQVAGGTVLRAGKDTLSTTLELRDPGSGGVVNLSKSPLFNSIRFENHRDFNQINHIDILVVDGSIGVAENGAVWLPENNLGERRFPFIARKLIILLNIQDLVPDLSRAYRKINLSRVGFGLWIAGPSKTADIEQSLVIGAQGALQHTVIITG